MRKPGVSETRNRILKFIRDFIEDRGYAPTVRDITKGCNVSSTSVVQHHLKILERLGYIRRDRKLVRSIQLTSRPNIVSVPLLGNIAAGEPIPVPSSDTWSNERAETIDVSADFTAGKQVYALRVKGTSMLDALIDDGDTVLMEATTTADNGDMVAVWLKDKQEVTLKRIYIDPGRVCLQPANRLMEPIYSEPENVEIQGKVVGVIRRL
jgi:repressor LexA